MSRNNFLNVFWHSLAVVLAISLAVVQAKAHGVEIDLGFTFGSSNSSRRSSSGSKKLEAKKVQAKNTNTARSFKERMVGIACPVTKYAKILGYVVGSILTVILLIVLFIKIKAKVADRRAASETYNRDSEEEEVELMFDDEKDGAVSDSDPSEDPSQHGREVIDGPAQGDANDSNPSGSTMSPPNVSIPISEPTKPNHSSKRTMIFIPTDDLTQLNPRHGDEGPLEYTYTFAKQTEK